MTATMVDAVIIHIYGSFLECYFCAVRLVIKEVVVFAMRGVFSEPLPKTCAKSQDDARRERFTPGRPVLPFGDVEGSNLRTRDGAV